MKRSKSHDGHFWDMVLASTSSTVSEAQVPGLQLNGDLSTPGRRDLNNHLSNVKLKKLGRFISRTAEKNVAGTHPGGQSDRAKGVVYMQDLSSNVSHHFGDGSLKWEYKTQLAKSRVPDQRGRLVNGPVFGASPRMLRAKRCEWAQGVADKSCSTRPRYLRHPTPGRQRQFFWLVSTDRKAAAFFWPTASQWPELWKFNTMITRAGVRVSTRRRGAWENPARQHNGS